MQKGDFSDAELQGVADDVQRNGKLKELADALEVVPQLESLESDVNAPLTLLQRWRLGVESSSEAHSLLLHHLKCIGLTKTSDRYSYIVMVTSQDYILKFVSFTDSTIENFLHSLTHQIEQLESIQVQ